MKNGTKRSRKTGRYQKPTSLKGIGKGIGKKIKNHGKLENPLIAGGGRIQAAPRSGGGLGSPVNPIF